jgi:hypothetical protein
LLTEEHKRIRGTALVMVMLLLIAGACENEVGTSNQADRTVKVTDSVESVADIVKTDQAERTVPCNQCGDAVSDPKELTDKCWHSAIQECGGKEKVTGFGVRELVRAEECTCTILCEPSAGQ